jgi:hypothetical protein
MSTTDTRFSELTADWVQEVMRYGGHSDATVAEVIVEGVPFTGATTDMARLRIGYAGAVPAGPSTVVAKLRGLKDVQRQMDHAMGLYEREARFYGTFAERVPVRSPQCFFIGDGDATPLLLQDLAGERMGDQMQGMTIADAEATLDALADLHAAFWESAALAEPWLASPSTGIFAAMITQLVSSGAVALAERFAGRADERVLAAVVTRAPQWGEIMARISEGPQTLVHNDVRLDNLFFASDGTPCFIDWQVLARTRGTQDVGNLLAGSMDSDDLTAQWARLLRRYHDRLLAGGVRGYSFDECVEHYRQSIVYPLGAGMALIGEMDIGDGRGLGERIIARCLAHIAELDSFAIL